MSEILFDNELPTEPRIPCLKLENGNYYVMFLGSFVALWIHWLGKLSEPCQFASCPKSVHRKRSYKRAYCSAMRLTENKNSKVYSDADRIVLPFSPHGLAEIIAKHGTLRGVYCVFQVTHKGRRCELLSHQLRTKIDALPSDFDPVPHVYRLFGRRPPATVRTENPAGPAQPFPADTSRLFQELENEKQESSSNSRNRKFVVDNRLENNRNGRDS